MSGASVYAISLAVFVITKMFTQYRCTRVLVEYLRECDRKGMTLADCIKEITADDEKGGAK